MIRETPEMMVRNLKSIKNAKPCPEQLITKHSVFDEVKTELERRRFLIGIFSIEPESTSNS